MTLPVRIIRTAWAELRANRGRSVITATCIAVAVAAFAVIMQLGDSAQQGVDDAVERTQGRAGTVRMTASGAPVGVLLEASRVSGDASERRNLTTAWGRRLELAEIQIGVDAPGDHPARVGLQAVDPAIIGALPATMSYGRWLTDADRDSLALPIVLGPTVARELAQAAGISPAGLVGRVLATDRPTRTSMRVVGVVRDGPLVRFLDQGNIGFVPLYADGAHRTLAAYHRPSESVDLFALFNVASGNDGTVLKTGASRFLTAAGQHTTEISTERVDRADDFAGASQALSTLLTAIGVIALLIGIIGVTNVNLMAVRERTREFGLRRALGSSPAVVSGLVMAETVMVILLGGTAGVAVATVLSWTASRSLAGALDGVPIGPMTATTASTALAASAACGLLAGFIPAWRAYRSTIIQAIRT